MSSTYKTVSKTNPTLQAVPTPEPLSAHAVEAEALEQLVSRVVAQTMNAALVQRPGAAPSPGAGLPAASLWSLVPKKWRPLVLVGAVVVLGSPTTLVAYGQRFAGLPQEVDSLRAEVAQLHQDLDEIKRLLRDHAPSSAPAR